MKPMTLKSLIFGVVLCAAGLTNAETPKGWSAAGGHPNDYEMTLDRGVSHGGKASATLKCIVSKPSDFGTLMQTCKVNDYRGNRVRMSGFVRATNVVDWAGLWLRVDGIRGECLAFDNMQDRAIKGTVEWKRCEIVLDVPEDSQQLAFGLLLAGTGQVWMDDLKFEVVGKEVPTTGIKNSSTPTKPTNLDFED